MSARAFSLTQVLQDGALATGPGAALNVAGLARIGVEVRVAGTATVGFEASIDGETWRALPLTLVEDETTHATATATGAFTGSVAGLAQFRARVVSWASGTVDVIALATAAMS